MRLSEKTLEINICAQISKMLQQRLIWFGLTQRQEAKLGFDTCIKLNGRLIIFQMKASNQTVNGSRKFSAKDKQLRALIKLIGSRKRCVFYALPMIGTTYELFQKRGHLLSDTWLLDVATIPSNLSFPRKRDGTLRKNGIHYIYLHPPFATIHSDPQRIEVFKIKSIFSDSMRDIVGINDVFENDFEKFEEFRKQLGRKFCGVIIF